MPDSPATSAAGVAFSGNGVDSEGTESESDHMEKCRQRVGGLAKACGVVQGPTLLSMLYPHGSAWPLHK